MFGSLLSPVVNKRALYLIYVSCVYLRVVVSNIYCVVLCFAFLRLVSCVWWCPTHVVVCFLFCLSSSCVLCMMVSSIYCVVFLFFFVYISSFSGLSIFFISPSVLSNVYLTYVMQQWQSWISDQRKKKNPDSL